MFIYIPPSRGLSFGGAITNSIAYLLFVVGIVAIMTVTGVIAWRCLKVKQIIFCPDRGFFLIASVLGSIFLHLFFSPGEYN